MATVKELQAKHIADLQALIDAAKAANQTLYDQRDALLKQVAPLHQQINDLSAKIVVAEGADVQAARRELAAIVARSAPQRGPHGPNGMRANMMRRRQQQPAQPNPSAPADKP